MSVDPGNNKTLEKWHQKGIRHPQTCILGDTTKIDAQRLILQRFLSLALCVDRKCTAIMWKSDSQLSIVRWVSEMNGCVPLEKITYTLRK